MKVTLPKLIETLAQLKTENRLPQALMIAGVYEAENEKIRLFTKSLVCAKQAQEPCEECKSCHLFDANTHPDYFYLEGNGSSIGIDEVRGLQQFLQQTQFLGKVKIAWIRNAQKLTLAATNALLKWVEEPVGNTIFIFSGTSFISMPKTLLSRCFYYKIESTDVAADDPLINRMSTDIIENNSLLPYLNEISSYPDFDGLYLVWKVLFQALWKQAMLHPEERSRLSFERAPLLERQVLPPLLHCYEKLHSWLFDLKQSKIQQNVNFIFLDIINPWEDHIGRGYPRQQHGR